MQLNIKKITVLLRDGHPDKITFDLDLTSPFPKMGYEPYASLDAEPGYGVQWCKDNFHIEPEVIDARNPRNPR